MKTIQFEKLIISHESTRILTGIADENSNSFGNYHKEFTTFNNNPIPIEFGNVKNYNHIESIWDDILQNKEPEKLKIMICENPIVLSTESRKKTTEIFFEKYEIDSICFASTPILKMISKGTLSGVCVDVGHTLTSSFTMNDGVLDVENGKVLNIGGREIEEYLRISNEDFFMSHSNVDVENFKKKNCFTSNGDKNERKDKKIEIELPDGQKISIDEEKLRNPVEILFNLDLRNQFDFSDYEVTSKTIQEIIYDSIHDSVHNDHFSYAHWLYSNINFFGNSFLMKNLKERTIKEVRKLYPKDLNMNFDSEIHQNSSLIGAFGLFSSVKNLENEYFTSRDYYLEEREIPMNPFGPMVKIPTFKRIKIEKTNEIQILKEIMKKNQFCDVKLFFK